MPCGWAGAILDADLTAGRISRREIAPYARDYIGGRALAARIAWDETPPGADAYDPENRIIVATGPLTGTLAPTSGRTIMTSISPRLYPRQWQTHSTLGGHFGAELKYAGFDAIVIHGRSDSPVYLEICDGHARLADGDDLWGLDARETQLALKKILGQAAQVLAIGPAGEKLVRFATVQHGEDNAAGHSGFGAVWGSKKLKAIVARGSGGVKIAHPTDLLQEVLRARTPYPVPCAAVVRRDDSSVRRPSCSHACMFNCLVSSYGETVDGRRIPGQCVAAVWRDDSFMKHTRYVSGSVIVPPGQNFGMCEEVTLHELCNSLGLDLWFRLVMQPWFIRCRQLGIDRIRGFPIEPANVFWFEHFMRQLAKREGLGDIFAEDLLRTMDELEGELPEELIRLGRELEFGFGFPAHREGRFWDEQPLPFWVISAMMYASESRDPTIGSHQSVLLLAELSLADREAARSQFRKLSQKVWGYADALDPTFENKAPVAIWSQNQHMLIDSLPMCDFAFPQVIRPMPGPDLWKTAHDLLGDLDLDRRLLAAVTGIEFSRDDLTRVAERSFTLERMLLARAGRGRPLEESLAPHFELPCRSDGTLIDRAGFSRLLDEYYTARRWDVRMGWPQAHNLEAVGLNDLVPALAELRRQTAEG